MPEQKITSQVVKDVIQFYMATPAATFFKALTGYGFQVKNGVESVDEISSGSGIIHPSYLFLLGGQRSGRNILTAEDVQNAVELFQLVPQAALLRMTTGKGFTVESGMPQMVDMRDAQSQTGFEITHYGGRSLSPVFVQELGKVTDPMIKWQSGFEYKNAMVGKQSTLIRHLVKREWESQEQFERSWQDLAREVARLTLFHCEDRLPKGAEGSHGVSRLFIMQELNRYLRGSGEIELQSGYNHKIRDDGVVIITKSLANVPDDEEGFNAAIVEFNKVCTQAYTLYCQPLGDKPKFGQPQGEVYDLAKVAKVEFGRDERRSTAVSESLIGWDDRMPVFPQEGWIPEKGKTFRVILQRWGKGLRATPAPAAYVERYVQKDERAAGKQTVRVEYDRAEKVISEADVELRDFWEFSESPADQWFARLEQMTDGWWIVETHTNYWRHLQEKVVDDYNTDVSGQKITKIDERQVEIVGCPSQRRFAPTRVWVEPTGFQGRDPHEEDFAQLNPAEHKYSWRIKAIGQNPDGKEVKVTFYLDAVKGTSLSWDDVPEELKQALLAAEWPICLCGQARYKQAEHTACKQCRDYRPCNRCGCGENTYFGAEKIAKALAAGEQLYCPKCSAWVEKIALVKTHITQAHKQAIAREADRLFQGTVVAFDDLENVLAIRNKTDHTVLNRITRISRLNLILEISDGYWATNLLSEQIVLCESLETQDDAEAVKIIALVTESKFHHRRTYSSSDYPPDSLNAKALENLAAQLDAGANVLAEFLTASPAAEKRAQEILERELPTLRAKWDRTFGSGEPTGKFTGANHELEKYGKQFILANYGTEYRNHGNARTRHAVLAEAEDIVRGSWKALENIQLTSGGIQWIREHKYSWDMSELLEAFHATPGFEADLKVLSLSEEMLREVVSEERKAFLERREETFWAYFEQPPKGSVTDRPTPKAYVFIDKDGYAWVNGGKSSKLGKFVVNPSDGDMECSLGVTLDEERKLRAWHPTLTARDVLCEDYSGSGNLRSYIEFYIPDTLSHGVWAVSEDEKGEFWYPVIYFDREGIVLPEETNIVVRSNPQYEDEANDENKTGEAVDLADALRKAWGAN